jgi:phage baseplate assembly protein W
MTIEFLGRGLSFPLALESRSAGGRGLAWSDGASKVQQSIWIILATKPGERVMRPEFGCGIHELVFRANTPALHDKVRSRVRDALVTFEPRIQLDDVLVHNGAHDDSGTDGNGDNVLLIEIYYRILGYNTLYNLVYPFYLQEGMA